MAVRRGDELLEELGVTRIDGIVLDVEVGNAGASGFVEDSHKPLPRWPSSMLDVALRAAGSSAGELQQQLNRLGWKTAAVDEALAGTVAILFVAGSTPSSHTRYE